MDPRNNEIFINYCNDLWDRNEIVIDNMFAFSVANEIINDDYEPRSTIECHQRQDWPKWKKAIQAELASLAKQDVFGPVARTPENGPTFTCYQSTTSYLHVYLRRLLSSGHISQNIILRA